MKPYTIPGVLALSLAASISAAAQDGATEEKPAAKAVTPPIEVPAAAEAPPAPDPATTKTDSSYGLGYRTGGEFGQRYGNFGVTATDLEMETFVKGFLDGFKGEEPTVSEEKLGAAMQALGDMLQKREEAKAADNLKAGEDFLKENAGKDGVVTTESGLQYLILEKGGEEKYVEPKEGEPAKQFLVNYKGTLIDGTEFDASPEGEPVPMDLNVIDGFKEALSIMPVGAKWKLFIPSKLAYGDQRRSAEIGPNTALVFELELTKIQDAPAAPAGLPFPMPEGVPGGQ
jgi:FKBP-type peptidyl-prolyl cis-trans isomerase